MKCCAAQLSFVGVDVTQFHPLNCSECVLFFFVFSFFFYKEKKSILKYTFSAVLDKYLHDVKLQREKHSAAFNSTVSKCQVNYLVKS